MYCHHVLPPTTPPPAILLQEVQLERIMLNIRSGRGPGGNQGLGFAPESEEAKDGYPLILMESLGFRSWQAYYGELRQHFRSTPR